MTSLKRIALFGSTGSIGKQALDVIAANPDKFSATILTAQTNAELLIQQALQFSPSIVVIGDEKKYETVKQALSPKNIKVFTGEDGLEEAAVANDYDLMIAGIVG
ncbi:MAG TPA: 1-deoxy-D-xylulose-5-phosphate reductoisomerase, partial [Chitinophagaceae bacterium]|nr:1-deoxy-D-xylulose-5-phosphate reductoisomerase [Chitinophagaceae bacterium]